MAPPDDVTLLLLGVTGSGKSATGNSVLRKPAFVSANHATSVTKDIQVGSSKIGNTLITVVDGPGFGDTDLTNGEEMIQMLGYLEQAWEKCPEGFDAILYVVRFDIRFTELYKRSVQLLKDILGPKASKSIILLMTFGENYDPDEHEGRSFSEWCQKQTSTFKDFLKECNNRVVLFKNKTKDNVEREKQFNELIGKVNELTLQQKRFSKLSYNLAALTRKRVMVQAHEPKTTQKVLEWIDRTDKELSAIKRKEPDVRVQNLPEMLNQVEAFAKTVRDEDMETGVLHRALYEISNLKERVEGNLQDAHAAVRQKRDEAKRNKELEEMEAKRKRDRIEHEKELQKKQMEKLRLQMHRRWHERRLRELEEVRARERNEKIADIVVTGTRVVAEGLLRTLLRLK